MSGVILKILIVIVGMLYYANSILLGMLNIDEVFYGDDLENYFRGIIIGIIAAMFWPISLSYLSIKERKNRKKFEKEIKEDLSQISEEP